MLSLHRAFDGDNSPGEALPPVWRSLEAAEIRFYRAALTMSVGRPGGGKSIFALNHAIKCAVPTLYISADMSRFTFAARAAAIITGEPVSSIREIVTTQGATQKYRAALKKLDHLYVAHEKRPTAMELEDLILAFEERWGIPPHLIVIDNLVNLLPQAQDEFAGLREMSHVLDFLAGDLGAAVHVLHHINIGGQPMDRPAPMTAVKGKIVELPSLILSGSKTDDQYRVTAVKNREGPEDPKAGTYITLDLNPQTLALSDPVPRVAPPTWAAPIEWQAPQ